MFMMSGILVQSTRTGNRYILKIVQEKGTEKYRIINLTKGHICPCIFDSKQSAMDDILKYQSEGKSIIIQNNISLSS